LYVEKREKVTIDMCFHLDEKRDPCTELPRWKLKNDKGRVLKACDAHLADGLRRCGLPARVDEYDPKS
jgi:hypothetical protein